MRYLPHCCPDTVADHVNMNLRHQRAARTSFRYAFTLLLAIQLVGQVANSTAPGSPIRIVPPAPVVPTQNTPATATVPPAEVKSVPSSGSTFSRPNGSFSRGEPSFKAIPPAFLMLNATNAVSPLWRTNGLAGTDRPLLQNSPTARGSSVVA